MKYSTNYAVAVNWCHNNFILWNDIVSYDSSVYENIRFSCSYLEDVDGNEYADESEVPEGVEIANEVDREIFQWFITDCTDDDVLYLENTFGLLFTYSDMLGKYILCVDHYGTAWDYVYCETTNEHAQAKLGETK